VDLTKRGNFGSKFGIIAAVAGSAIGLGNIWRFPYVAGSNGGGAFLLIYVIIVLAVGIPVMLSEFIIGRATQRNPFDAFKKLKPNGHWYIIGIMGIFAAFMILAFYSTVAGWTLEYLYQSAINGFNGKSAGEINQMFTSFNTQTLRPVMWQIIFMLMTAVIVLGGVEKGIEKYTKILMPLLLIIIIILDVKALSLPDAREGISFLFKPDFSKIKPNVILSALGQAFFSLSIGMGTLITYGSYIQKKHNLTSSAAIVIIADTTIAILAGVAIFPIVFHFGLKPTEGVALVFKTLPNIFPQMTGGTIFAMLFFILLSVAAITSSISLLEVIVAFFVERLKMRRINATIFATVSVSYLGTLCAMSEGGFSDFRLFNLNFFDLLDNTAAKILLPLGGFFIALFVGWFYGKDKTWMEISNNGKLKVGYLNILMFLIRYIAPLAIALVFLNGMGVFKF
jgi:NSS family neurotransmitter:Na+ symporter